MQRILVSFGFVLVLETVIAVGTCVLFFHFVDVEVMLRLKLFRLFRAAFAYKAARVTLD